MVTTAVLGAAGFSGQETLDRVLAHPTLELVALGSDSLAGQPASALDPRLSRNGHGPLPRFVPNEEAARRRRRARLLLPGRRRGGCARPAARRGRRRPLGRASDRRRGWCYALPELAPPDRPADRESRAATRPQPCSRSAPIAGIVDRRRRRRRRQVGHLGRGAHAEGSLARRRRARQRHAVRGRCAQACARDRAAARLPGHLRPPRRAAPPRAVCTCYVGASEDPRPLLEAAYAESHVVEVVDAVPDLARVQGTDAAEVAAFEDGATGRWIVICAIDNLGKGAAGQAVQNANLALGLEETAGLRLSGCSSDGRRSRAQAGRRHRRDHAAAGLRRRRRPRRYPQGQARPSRRPLHRARGRRRDVHRQPGAGRARARLEGAPRAGGAAGGRRQLGCGQRRDRQAGRARRAGDCCADSSAPRARAGSGARPLHRCDRREAADAEAARRPPRDRARRRRRRRGGRGDPHHRHVPEGGAGRLAAASPSAGWRRARE